MQPTADRLKTCLALHPDWTDRRVSASVRCAIGDVRAARGNSPPVAPTVAPPTPKRATGGITLEGVNVYSQRPQDRAKGLIHSLTRGRGFPLKELSAQWGMSEDAIAGHAKRFECFRYVETEPGKYLPCVLHPDTARQFGG